MSMLVDVLFEDGKQQRLQLSSHTDNVICEVKRRVFDITGILPICQRLQLVGSTDNFEYPAKIRCTKRVRNAKNSLLILGFNKEEFKLNVDPNDHILDIKFLLSQALQTKPEYLRISVNDQSVNDNQSINELGCLQPNAAIRYWFEFPTRESDHGTVHRTVATLYDVDSDFATIAHSIRRQGKLIPKWKHFGTRTFKQDGTRGDFRWMTFEDINKRISDIGAGLRKLGLQPRDTRIGICSKNRAEWCLVDYAGQLQSFITVPLYDTLAKNAIEYIVNHAEVQVVACTQDTLAEIVKAKNKCPSLQYIILMDDAKPDKEFANAHPKSGFTHRLSEIEKMGQKHPVNDVMPDINDLCTICYTSGTTGNPKGVMLTHRNLMSMVNATYLRMPDEYLNDNDDAVLSYLPLAHIYERLVELVCMRAGARVGYYSGAIETLVEDIQALQPSMFVGVPRVYQKIQDKVLAEVNKSNIIRRTLFNHAFKAKESAINQGLPMPGLWERLVFSKVKDKFGGKIKACVSGSAPLSKNTQMFMKVCMSDITAEGYGLTETSAGGTSSDKDDNTAGHVGMPVPCAEVKLVDVPDMNYFTTDEPCPRGEIWIRGSSVFKGYYKNIEKTQECLTEDGWFATGDVGKWLANGKLAIIDRKKNIFKLAQGEYIRPEYIENVYKQSPYIANAFVYGNSFKTFLVAIIVPDWEVIPDWAKQNGLADIANDPVKLTKHPKLVALIRKDMQRLAQREELTGFERVNRFLLRPDDFTIENGLLTASMKLKRHEAKIRFEPEIEELYAQVAKSKL